MSCLSLGKKLLPARKAWKRFTSTLQTRLRKLKRSKTIKYTKARLNTTLDTYLGHSRRWQSYLPRKQRAPPRPNSALRVNHHKIRHHRVRPGFAPVYVDELFRNKVNIVEPALIETAEKGTTSSSATVKAIEKGATSSSGTIKAVEKGGTSSTVGNTSNIVQPTTIKAVEKTSGTNLGVTMKTTERGSTSSSSNGSESTAAVGAVPQLPLWGVDERAEKFIATFREEMWLQRQKSFREYQEMIARGAM